MTAQVAQPQRTEHGVGQRVAHGVGVTVTAEPATALDLDAAQHERTVGSSEKRWMSMPWPTRTLTPSPASASLRSAARRSPGW